MLDKKIKLRGAIFLCSAVGGAISLWSMFGALSYKLASKYLTTSIALTTLIVISALIVCLAAIFQLNEEYLSIIYTLLGLSILITFLNIVHGCVIPIKECKYFVLSMSLAASINGITCVILASVLRYYYKIPIPTDKWYCQNSWP